jgi:cysteinyl-tRNA synthetase
VVKEKRMSEAFRGLRLYNTLSREKEDFVPLDPHNVRLYVCGPTVYDFAHIGNARPVIVFDVLYRLLRHLYGADHVTYVRNITDVDDKINARALRDFGDDIRAGRLDLNQAIGKVTQKTADQFHEDVKALGCLEPDFEPRATDFVLPRDDGKTDMVGLIQSLIERGHAYAAEGEILFDTASMPDYGRLSRRRLEDQQAGAQEDPGRFRVVETVVQRRARMGRQLRHRWQKHDHSRPARLAHRMLGDVGGLSRRGLRHSRWRA